MTRSPPVACRDAVLLVAFAAALSGCTAPPTACGEPAPFGGPPRISTLEQELCEIVRLRLEHVLTKHPNLDEFTAQRWLDRSWGWGDAKTVDGVVAQVRADCGDAFAEAVRRAADEVRRESKRTIAPSCEDAERCLARGAALGARLAVDNALYYLRYEAPKPAWRPNTSGDTP